MSKHDPAKQDEPVRQREDRAPRDENIVRAIAAREEERRLRDELDATYDQAIAEGLVTEEQINDAFERFLDSKPELGGEG